jgi:hypothetical protein
VSFEQGAAVAAKTSGPTRRMEVGNLIGATECLLALGRAKEATVAARRAYDLAGQLETDPGNLTTIQVALGMALLGDGDRRGARVELEAARRRALELGPRAPPLVEAIEKLLARAR